MRFDEGMVLSAEWDGDGTWRVVEVLSIDGERLEVLVHADQFPGPPAAGALAELADDGGERHSMLRDELAAMWPAEIPGPPEHRRATRRGLLEGLLRTGIERSEQIARRRRPWR
jgi:hypothetical protein